ncbi:quinone oxidoreductase [Fibrella sp. HMF5335]|uniref:Quinone oxidoreductase n=1 Tax=Fibrella rubiginis TaxID=2817060 RepID=A0A939GIW2_9BACT|nr:quinone oxidoreductase [Fibrella rubiginis]MBO0939136.1 quinone oxidoreductase [Fibrella rubiginis]
MNALTFSAFGDASVLIYQVVPDPVLKPGQVLVSMKAIGLNFADIYRRKGNYHLTGQPPYMAGYEGAGVVVDANNVPAVRVGDRVGFADVPLANAELVAVPADRLIPLPDVVSFETAAAVLLQGLTAHYLVTDSHPVQPGEVLLVHAAAGGVGQLLVQMGKRKGATVLGLSTSVAKLPIIEQAGADAAFVLSPGWTEAVRRWPAPIDVVYDSVGATLSDSLAVVRDGGRVVFYGMSGGNPAPVDPRYLMDTSKTLTGGDLWSYLTSKHERVRRSAQLFDWLQSGAIRLAEPTRFALADGAAAHRFLESGQSAGKVLLIPSYPSTTYPALSARYRPTGPRYP